FAAPSLWPVLAGKEAKATDLVISTPTLSHRGMKQPQPTNRATISDGRWLLVYGWAGSGDSNDGTASGDRGQREDARLTGEKLAPELYDLHDDPGCLKNVIAGQGERARDLHRRFYEFLRRSSMRKDHLAFFQRI